MDGMNRHRRVLALELEIPAYVPEQADDKLAAWVRDHLVKTLNYTDFRLIGSTCEEKKPSG